MEFTKEYLVKKRTEYLNTAEKCKLDSIANAGAADVTLHAGSPAIGTGVYIPSVSTANPPNIGAN